MTIWLKRREDSEKNLMDEKTLHALKTATPYAWQNPLLVSWDACKNELPVSEEDILDAKSRMERFAPFIRTAFPETSDSDGIIESVLTRIPNMQAFLNEHYAANLQGKLLIKQDNMLPIAGSVKARGGIHEVLAHTEQVALSNGILSKDDDYSILASDDARRLFSSYTMQAASTGNLGLSIGITSSAVGYNTIIHMSRDARQWKKDLLREKGATVKEYETDYSKAVELGRAASDADPRSYFVDDENSMDLFVGYAAAAYHLKEQLDDMGIPVDEEHPLFVYIPCGVGGAPGGIAFGLKSVFGDHVHVFFAEPVQAPCMLLGMASRKHNDICVQDIGLTCKTHADGLAVGRPSQFVGKVMDSILSGIITLDDAPLYEHTRELLKSEGIFIEPSSSAAIDAVARVMSEDATVSYIEDKIDIDKMKDATHIIWSTGGSLVPDSVRREYLDTYLV